MPLFQKVVSGPSSYPLGGFVVQVGEYEKIESANVFMDPTTKLATTVIPGFNITRDSTTLNVVRVKVFRYPDPTGTWGEVASGTDLNAANFILTGKAY